MIAQHHVAPARSYAIGARARFAAGARTIVGARSIDAEPASPPVFSALATHTPGRARSPRRGPAVRAGAPPGPPAEPGDPRLAPAGRSSPLSAG